MDPIGIAPFIWLYLKKKKGHKPYIH